LASGEKTVIKDPLVKNKITTALKKDPLCKRIIIIDDEPDITLTLKATLEGSNTNNANNKFEVYTYNDPLAALLEFKPHFYDLLLIDINMPYMDGFELCKKILELDVNVRVCFMTAEVKS
jgi:CheY-like chemotaxis protein